MPQVAVRVVGDVPEPSWTLTLDRLPRARAALVSRLSLERTRRATWFEQLTVGRLTWNQLVRLNRYLEFFGKLTTAIWVAFLATTVLGVDWKEVVQDAVNNGRPVDKAFVLVLLLPTLLFVAARSLIGFARWRLQRELWRREVARRARSDAEVQAAESD